MSYHSGGPTTGVPTGVLSMPRIPPPPGNRRRAIVLFVVLGVLTALVAAYLVMVFTLGGKVPSGTTVAGVDIGGLGRTEASRKLQAELGDRADGPIEVRAGDESFELEPAEAGLSFDAEATVDAAYVEKTFDPVTLVGLLGGGEPVAPVVDSDDKALSAAVKKLAKQIDREPREGTITFAKGIAKATMPEVGFELRQDRAVETLRTGFMTTDGAIELPTAETSPAVDRAGVEKAMTSFAEPAMSGPVTLRIGEESVQASVAQIGGALTMKPGDDGGLAPVLDGKKLVKALGKRLDAVLGAPKDARIEMSGGKPRVVPGKVGHTVEPDKLAAAVIPALTKTGDERVAAVSTVEKQPDLTTEELKGLGVKEVVGEFTTHFPYAEYRNVNIGRAASLMNGTLVLPGETFSMNDTVGERTAENGFTGGYVIKGGNLAVEMGGGVSQTATTMYNAAFFAGMVDVQHRPHGFYISRYPVGREATVYWGSLDLKWKNNTPYAVYVQAYTNRAAPGRSGSVTFKLWSTKYWEVKTKTSDRYNIVPFEEIEDDSKDGCVDQPEGVNGFEVDVYRYIYRQNKLVKTEKDHVKYKPEHKIKCKYPDSVD
ncbi:MAG TPA: VanW family protein [Actinopolymorphaceae bacterium]